MHRKTKFITKLIILLVVIIIAAGGTIGYGYMTIKNNAKQISSLQNTIDSNTQTVYVAIAKIGQGDLLYDEKNATSEHPKNIEKQKISTGLPSTSYLSANQIGSKAVVDINSNEPIMANMVTDANINADTRNFEISVTSLMTTQKNGDFVDVRIVYPNGEDYVVLAKKQVRDLNLKNCIWTAQLSEEEILRLQSATIDAYTISGTKIYVDKYIQSNLQQDAIPNYLVKPETIDLMNSDPNILSVAQDTLNVQARTDLETRLGKLSEDQLSAVSKGFGLTDTSKNSVILGTDASKESGSSESTESADNATETSESTAAKSTTASKADTSNTTSKADTSNTTSKAATSDKSQTDQTSKVDAGTTGGK